MCENLWDKAWGWEQALQSGRAEKKAELRSRARRVGECKDTGRVAYAMAQAVVWGRAAQGRGLSGLTAFRRAEKWASKAYERDPEFLEGMPRRVLGTMWAMGGQYLPGKDSESGLELLAEQVQAYPEGDENVLRLMQALVGLGDLDGAHDVYCAYSGLPKAWTQLHPEGKVLKSEIEKAFLDEALACPDRGELS